MTQDPPVQLPLALVKLQTFEHDPQCRTSVERFDSQPFAGFVSQFPNPTEHAARVQDPPTQALVAWGSAAHAEPQAPQFCKSVDKFTQACPHSVVPAGQQSGTGVPVQEAFTHLSSEVQEFPSSHGVPSGFPAHGSPHGTGIFPRSRFILLCT